MSIIQSNAVAPPPAAAGGSSGALSSISGMNSLRFDGSSYGSRIESRTGNPNKMTVSFWVKISKLDRTNYLIGHSNSAGDDTHSFQTYINSSNQIQVSCAGVYQRSHAILRETSAWYHIVVSLDSTTTATERLKTFLNGDKLAMDTSFSGGGYPSDTSNLSLAGYIFLVSDVWNRDRHFNGYMANVQFIDGQALDPNSFGETVSDVWVPKQYGSGDPSNASQVLAEYGTNGFHLDFADANNIGNDVSGRGNHWTLN